MSGIGSGYDLSTTTYSPDGRVFQVEYAGKAVDNGGLTVGVKCADGCVIACEKLVPSKLHTPGTSRRINAVARHAGIGGSGYVPDMRAVLLLPLAQRKGQSDGALWLPVFLGSAFSLLQLWWGTLLVKQLRKMMQAAPAKKTD